MDHFELAMMLHKEHLRKAAKAQLYQQFALATPPFRKRLLLRLGDLLIAVVGVLGRG